MGRVRGFERSAESRAYISMGRAEMCLSSMCAILNATRPEPGKYDVAALVDDATPVEVLAGYARNGVTIIPMHTRVNPPAHYLGPHTRRGPSLGDLGPKIAESMKDAERRAGWKLKAATLRAADATTRGLPTLYHVPYGIYRLWAWAMVEYREARATWMDVTCVRVCAACAPHYPEFVLACDLLTSCMRMPRSFTWIRTSGSSPPRLTSSTNSRAQRPSERAPHAPPANLQTRGRRCS